MLLQSFLHICAEIAVKSLDILLALILDTTTRRDISVKTGSCKEAHLMYLLHNSRTQVSRQWLLRCHSWPYSRQ